MILVVLSTHAELESATARGRSYWETGELGILYGGQGQDSFEFVGKNMNIKTV